MAERGGAEALLAVAARGRPSSCDVSDACDQLGIEVARTGVLRPLWPECTAISGRLTTVRLEPAQDAPTPLVELVELLAQASDGLVYLDLGGRTDCQCWGSVLATAARHFGVQGVLVNGAARDVEGLRELAFPTYARGVYPGAIRGRLRLVSIGEPVELDGSPIEAGSFAVADASGAVFVPATRAEEVLAVAAQRKAREQEQLEAVAGGSDPRAVFGSDQPAAKHDQ